jgi:DNA-binding GntR family transcriptional regulator
MITHPAPSEIALSTLAAMRRLGAVSADTAVTDAQIAEAIGVAHRHVIDARGELLEAGYLVVAGGNGSYVTNDVAAAREYLESLEGRARGILSRRRALKRAIERHELRRDADSRGQLILFPESKDARRTG